MAPRVDSVVQTSPTVQTPVHQVVSKPYPTVIYWGNVIKLGLIHLMALYGAYLYPYCKWQTNVFGFIYLMCSGISVTAGAHRLWCHRSYKAKLPLRIVLMIWNCIAAQNDLYDWVRDHRVHHKYSETDADPHNVNRGFFFAHVGWLMVNKHPEVTKKGKSIDCSDVIADPVVQFQRKYYMPLVIFFSFYLPTVVPYYLCGESYWNAFFTTAILRLVLSLNFTWSVNSFAHIWGTKPFDKYISPTETQWVSLFAVGEGFHNYHHTFPWDYSTSELGWKLNASTMFIDIMAKLGLAYDLKTAPKELVEQRKLRTGDGSRLPETAKASKFSSHKG